MDVASPSYVGLEPLRTALSGRYRIDRELGHGGMAIVYLADDIKHGRRVAIKVLRPELTSGVGTTRFLREIEIASRLTHPNLLPLHDSGESAGYLYYVMPYVDGETLRALIQRKKQLPLDEALRIAADVAQALAYAHRQGVVHRDIKPENILLQEGRAIVADFGVARALLSSTPSGTTSGIVIGTASYMSPEQGSGDPDLDARSDLYSLGCVLYEMLAGEPPFTGPSPQAIVARHATERLPSLRIIRPDLPVGAEAVVNRALAKVPADRYQTAEQFGRALSVDATIVSARPTLSRRRRVIATAAAVSLVAVGAYAIVAMRTPLRQDDWVLVSDFDAPPDDPQLGPAVRELATQVLKQSRFVRVFDRRQLNEVMRRANVPETTVVTGARARELASRSSIRAVLQGAVRKMDATTYEVVIHVIDPEDGASLASAVGTGPEPMLPTVVQGLVRDVRQRLGERRGAIASNRPIRDVMTPSFDAFRRYTLALDRVVQHGDVAGSNGLIREAIALDTGFASAWAMLGANYLNSRQLDSARWAYERALSIPDRLGAAEVYRLKGDVAFTFDHDARAAIRWYDLMLAESPHSSSGHSNRALYRSAGGDYVGALADLERAVALNPFGAQLVQATLLNYGAILVVVGRLDDARRVVDSLSGAPRGYLETMIATAAGRWSRADSVASREIASTAAQGVFRINAVTSLAGALAARGDPAAADSVLRAAAAASRGSTARWYERARLLLAITAGRPIVPRVDLVPADTTPSGRLLRGLWAAVAGDTTSARASLARVASLSPAQLAAVGHTPALIEAWIAGHSGNWRRATDLLSPLARRGEHDPLSLDRPDSFILRWSAATAYRSLGDTDSATAFIKMTLPAANMPPGHFALRGLSQAFAEARISSPGGPSR